jgi:putative flippase GtrA
MRINEWHPHLRQGGQFLIIGLAQLTLDTAVFVSVTALGMSVAPGNILGRISGASLGFWLNGRYTFADQGRPRLSGRHLGRFVVAWSLLTALSSALLYVIEARSNLHMAWLAKPLLEAFNAAIGFVVWRQWVYR